jgi:hypothetical protein
VEHKALVQRTVSFSPPGRFSYRAAKSRLPILLALCNIELKNTHVFIVSAAAFGSLAIFYEARLGGKSG